MYSLLVYTLVFTTLKHILDDHNLWKVARDIQRQYVRSHDLHIQQNTTPFSNAYPTRQSSINDEQSMQCGINDNDNTNTYLTHMPDTPTHPRPGTPAHPTHVPSPHTSPRPPLPSALHTHAAHTHPLQLPFPMGSLQSPSTSGNERNSDWTTT